MHPNVDPLFLRQRKGTEDDPYIYLEDTANVFNGSIVLREIPSYSDDLVVVDSEGNELMKANSVSDIGLNEYMVDYTDGLVYFHKDNEGKQYTVKYWGTGMLSLPSTRIFVPNASGDPLESLQDILNNVEEGTAIIEEVRNIEYKGEYDPTVQYQKWNFVTFGNKTFVAMATIQGVSPAESSNWKLVSSGVGFVGVYDSEKTYHIGDMVADEESKNIYFSKIMDNTYPLTDEGSWELMISLDDLVEKFEEMKNELQDFENILESSDQEREQREQQRQQAFEDLLEDYESYHMLVQADEEARNANEEMRIEAESERNQLEDIRQTNEAERISNEEARVIAEQARVEAFDALMQGIEENTGNTIDELNDLINELRDLKGEITDLIAQAQQKGEQLDEQALELGQFVPVGEFNIEQVYHKYNIVSHEGSSYMAKQTTQGNEITDEEYWFKLASKGLDGTAISIDGIYPDESGEINTSDLGLVREEDYEVFQDEMRSQIGDLDALMTSNNNNLVEAINELKVRLDMIVGNLN